MTHYSLTIDGKSHQVDVDDPDTPLLYVLRDELRLNNPRFGCGLGQCGACTVHVNGDPARSCLAPISSVENAAVTTLAGIGSEDKPHPLQVAWIAEEASQCGYCLNGWMMTATALLRENPQPSDAQIRDRLSGIKCRCGAHVVMIRAIKRAGKMMAGAQP